MSDNDSSSQRQRRRERQSGDASSSQQDRRGEDRSNRPPLLKLLTSPISPRRRGNVPPRNDDESGRPSLFKRLVSPGRRKKAPGDDIRQRRRHLHEDLDAYRKSVDRAKPPSRMDYRPPPWPDSLRPIAEIAAQQIPHLKRSLLEDPFAAIYQQIEYMGRVLADPMADVIKGPPSVPLRNASVARSPSGRRREAEDMGSNNITEIQDGYLSASNRPGSPGRLSEEAPGDNAASGPVGNNDRIASDGTEDNRWEDPFSDLHQFQDRDPVGLFTDRSLLNYDPGQTNKSRDSRRTRLLPDRPEERPLGTIPGHHLPPKTGHTPLSPRQVLSRFDPRPKQANIEFGILRTRKVKSAEVNIACGICSGQLKPNADCTFVPCICWNVYHKTCITEWLHNRKDGIVCPKCKWEISKDGDKGQTRA